MLNNMVLYFGPDSFFSNFSPHRVLHQGTYFATAEHAYQAEKFFGIQKSSIYIDILYANSPELAKEIARINKPYRVENWQDRKIHAMDRIVRAKFSQHPQKHEELMQTGSAVIIENSPHDAFWGRGPDWKGLNCHGKIWMNIRHEINMQIMKEKNLNGLD